jgi:FecR protein
MKKSIIQVIGGMILAGLTVIPALAADSALPGTVNYVEGKAAIGDQALNSKSVGSAQLEPGASLVTNTGKAEILLTPGVFLRVNDDSAVQLVSGALTNTEIRVERGSVLVEVDELHKENNLRVIDNGATTQLKKTGVYEFDADHAQVLVFKGEAEVQEGDQHQKVKGGHEVTFSDAKLKSTGFDKDRYDKSDLYKFSSLRSQYLSEASADAAGYNVNAAWAPGWFWDPWYSAYTFFPGAGFLYSPFGFGWGFYSPAWVGYYGAPGFYYGHRGYYNHGVPYTRAHGGFAPRASAPHAMVGHIGGGFGGGGFHAGGGSHR